MRAVGCQYGVIETHRGQGTAWGRAHIVRSSSGTKVALRCGMGSHFAKSCLLWVSKKRARLENEDNLPGRNASTGQAGAVRVKSESTGAEELAMLAGCCRGSELARGSILRIYASESGIYAIQQVDVLKKYTNLREPSSHTSLESMQHTPRLDFP